MQMDRNSLKRIMEISKLTTADKKFPRGKSGNISKEKDEKQGIINPQMANDFNKLKRN